MMRLWLLFAMITGAELWAFQVFREHPLVLPGYFHLAVLVIQAMIVWGAVTGARWLLRHSPAARRTGPSSDWLRLWIWVGPPGGVLFGLACLIGKYVASVSLARIAGPLVVAHLAGGALVWLAASIWAVPEMFSDEQSSVFDKLMALVGFVTHVFGLWIFTQIYPGWAKESLMSLVGPVVYFGLFLYYVLVTSLAWDLIFRFARRQR